MGLRDDLGVLAEGSGAPTTGAGAPQRGWGRSRVSAGVRTSPTVEACLSCSETHGRGCSLTNGSSASISGGTGNDVLDGGQGGDFLYTEKPGRSSSRPRSSRMRPTAAPATTTRPPLRRPQHRDERDLADGSGRRVRPAVIPNRSATCAARGSTPGRARVTRGSSARTPRGRRARPRRRRRAQVAGSNRPSPGRTRPTS